jgi:hypothetical protein
MGIGGSVPWTRLPQPAENGWPVPSPLSVTVSRPGEKKRGGDPHRNCTFTGLSEHIGRMEMTGFKFKNFAGQQLEHLWAFHPTGEYSNGELEADSESGKCRRKWVVATDF